MVEHALLIGNTKAASGRLWPSPSALRLPPPLSAFWSSSEPSNMHKLISAYATYFSAHGIDAAAPPSPRRLVSSCNIHYLASPYVLLPVRR